MSSLFDSPQMKLFNKGYVISFNQKLKCTLFYENGL